MIGVPTNVIRMLNHPLRTRRRYGRSRSPARRCPLRSPSVGDFDRSPDL